MLSSWQWSHQPLSRTQSEQACVQLLAMISSRVLVFAQLAAAGPQTLTGKAGFARLTAGPRPSQVSGRGGGGSWLSGPSSVMWEWAAFPCPRAQWELLFPQEGWFLSGWTGNKTRLLKHRKILLENSFYYCSAFIETVPCHSGEICKFSTGNSTDGLTGALKTFRT